MLKSAVLDPTPQKKFKTPLFLVLWRALFSKIIKTLCFGPQPTPTTQKNKFKLRQNLKLIFGIGANIGIGREIQCLLY